MEFRGKHNPATQGPRWETCVIAYGVLPQDAMSNTLAKRLMLDQTSPPHKPPPLYQATPVPSQSHIPPALPTSLSPAPSTT